MVLVGGHRGQMAKASRKTISICLYMSGAGNQPGRCLDDKGIKKILKEERETAEKLKDFYASMFTVRDIYQCQSHYFLDGPEILSQTEVTRYEVQGLLDKFKNKNSKSLGPDGIQPKILKELQCEIVGLLLTSICNIPKISLCNRCLESSKC